MSEMFKSPELPSPDRPNGGFDLSDAARGINTKINSADLFAEMRANGLGHKPEDLLPASGDEFGQGDKPEWTFAGLRKETPPGPRTQAMRRSGVFDGTKVGSMTTTELDTVMAARAPWEQGDGSTETSNPDSAIDTAAFDKWLGENFDPAGLKRLMEGRDPAKSRRILEGMFLGEVNPNSKIAEYDRENPDFATWVNTLPTDFVDKLKEERGEGGATAALLRMHRGEQPESQRPEGTFKHASTGENVTLDEAAAQIEHPMSPEAQAAIKETVDAVSGEIPTKAETKLSPEVAEEMKASVENLINAVERGDILNPNDSGVTEILVGPAADGVNVEFVTTGTGDGHTEKMTVDVEGHVVEVTEAGDTTIDGELVVSDQEAATIAGVLEHIAEEAAPDESPEPTDSSEQLTEDLGPPQLETATTDEIPNDLPEQTTAQTEATTPDMPPTRENVVPEKPLVEKTGNTVETDKNTLIATDLVKGYLMNPRVQELLGSAGIDVKSVYDRLKSGTLVADPYAIKEVFALASEIKPQSEFFSMFRPNPRGSGGERSVAEYQARLKSIFEKL